MDISIAVMWLGFFLASYSVVGNDVIQTLGTFLTSNEKTVKWWVLWLFAAIILTLALTYGYLQSDITYGRLDKFQAELSTLQYHWYYLLPPIVLLTITRWGIPVSTTFMILFLFSLHSIPGELKPMLSSIADTDSHLGGMIQKSVLGYVVAFSAAFLIYILIARLTEKRFLRSPVSDSARPYWVAAQWLTTGFLWFQWLTQDLANIYVYLRGGNAMSFLEFLFSLIILLALLAYIFYTHGGAVQKVVRKKTNTADIRSATYIDLIYSIILYVFKYDSFMGLEYQFPWTGNLPMSTTWVFVGLLAGREIGMKLNLYGMVKGKTSRVVFADLGKVFFGLVVSILLVLAIKLIAG